MKVLIDTGPLVCLFDRQEEHYQICSDQAKKLPGKLYTCLPVITEAAYLLNRQDSRLVDLLYAACRDGVYVLLPITASDFEQVRNIRNQYDNLGLDFADACLMHLGQREGIDTVFTIDRRDFSAFRKQDGRAFSLLPDFA